MPTLYNTNTAVVILAAGKGKRMNSAKLKVMHELKGKPLIEYTVTAVESLGLSNKPVVVVRTDDQSVQEYLGDRVDYAVQEIPLGTGQAVMMAEPALKDKVEQVVVLYGDMPFVTAKSLEALIAKHVEKNNRLTLMTTIVEDFNDWRVNFYEYGRIIRGGTDNYINKIVEKKDATPAELDIKELNTAFFCFNADWLWQHLHQLKNTNAQGEYYLTDLVGMAFSEGEKLSSVLIDPKEAVGVNTVEHLINAEKI